jgi:hypothetical protein
MLIVFFVCLLMKQMIQQRAHIRSNTLNNQIEKKNNGKDQLYKCVRLLLTMSITKQINELK